MTRTQKIILLLIIFITVVVLFFTYEREIETVSNANVATSTTPAEKMILTVYVQDQEAAAMFDCGATQKITYEIPRTTGVADASLIFLFEKELAEYGQYDSVAIENKIAKVKLKNDIPSLSSCQIGHLTSVLTDTLTQYPTISAVEIYGPKGKFEY